MILPGSVYDGILSTVIMCRKPELVLL